MVGRLWDQQDSCSKTNKDRLNRRENHVTVPVYLHQQLRKLFTHLWFTCWFKAEGRHTRPMLFRVEGPLPHRHGSCFQNGHLQYGVLLSVSQDLTYPRQNLSSLCSQRWPWTSDSPASSPWVQYSIVFAGAGGSFSRDVGEGKVHRSITTPQKNNARWWLPCKQCSLQVTSKALPVSRDSDSEMMEMWLLNTLHVAGQRDDIADNVSQPGF